jgi:polar amino acid transport system substrate-binding protein
MMKKLLFVTVLAVFFSLMLIGTAPAGPVMDRITKKGELIVGITGTQPPLNITTKENEIIGLDADISKMIAVNMGVKLRFAKMPFADLLPALKAGKVDMILSSMTITPDRNLKVAFIGPYYVSGKGILTKQKNVASVQASGLNQPQFKVAALKASTSASLVEKTAPQAKLVLTGSYDEALGLLFEDKIDALVADYPFCAFSSFRHQDKGLAVGESRLTFEPLGIAVQEDALLINWLENFLKALNGSGELDRLYDRWLKDGSWIKQLP